jgi:hypothetical protein
MSKNIREEIFHGEITIGWHILGFGFKLGLLAYVYGRLYLLNTVKYIGR